MALSGLFSYLFCYCSVYHRILYIYGCCWICFLFDQQTCHSNWLWFQRPFVPPASTTKAFQKTRFSDFWFLFESRLCQDTSLINLDHQGLSKQIMRLGIRLMDTWHTERSFHLTPCISNYPKSKVVHLSSYFPAPLTVRGTWPFRHFLMHLKLIQAQGPSILLMHRHAVWYFIIICLTFIALFYKMSL